MSAHRFLALLMAAGWSAGLSFAAPGAPLESGPAKPAGPKRFSLALQGERPQAAFYRIGKEAGETVLADSTVARGAITADWKGVTAEEAIADACKQINASWKRVYLPPGTAATADNVSQIYRSLRALHAGGLVAFEPADGRGTVLLLNAQLPGDYEKAMEQPNTGFRKAYLVLYERVPLVPEGAAQDDGRHWQPGEPLTPGKMARLQRDLFGALSQMSPEQRQVALQATMASQMEVFAQNPQFMAQMVRESAGMQMEFITQNPEVLQTVMQSAMQAQIEALQRMTPEKRQLLMKVQMDMVRQIPPEQMKQLTDLMRGAAP